MPVTQYIGARYMPIFADPPEHSTAKTYEPLTIVLHEGNSYTSKQFVPKGIAITNETYWAETGNYNAQVEQYRQETARAVEHVNALDTELNAKIDTVDAKLDNTANDIKSTIGPIGLISIGKNRTYDAENGTDYWAYYSIDGINFSRIRKLSGLTGSSAALAKIGDWYYFTNGKAYQKSLDLINWSERFELEIPEITALNDKFWAGTIFNDTNRSKLYYMCSYQYSDEAFTNGLGVSDTENHKIIFIEISQTDDGMLSRVNGADIITFQPNARSYIDPFCVYHNPIGYILAVKNELTSTVEIWSGYSLQSLEKQDILAPLYGIEAPQLVETFDGVTLYVDGYAPAVINYTEYGESCKLDWNKIPSDPFSTAIVRKGRLESYCVWDLVSFGVTVSHPGYITATGDVVNNISGGNISYMSQYTQRQTLIKQVFTSYLSQEHENYLTLVDHPYINYTIGGVAAACPVTLLYKNIFNSKNRNIPIGFLGPYTLAATLKIGTGFSDVTTQNTHKLTTPVMNRNYGVSYIGMIRHYNTNNPRGKTLLLPVEPIA